MKCSLLGLAIHVLKPVLNTLNEKLVDILKFYIVGLLIMFSRGDLKDAFGSQQHTSVFSLESSVLLGLF